MRRVDIVGVANLNLPDLIYSHDGLHPSQPKWPGPPGLYYSYK